MTADLVLSSLVANASASLAAPGDFFWSAPIFQRDTWNSAMMGLRLVLTFGGAALILYWWRARKLGERVREKTVKRIAVAMTVLSFGVYFDFFNPNVRYPDYYHRHEFFHYYLGSKYAEELSYTRLYECAAIAEAENGHRAAVARRELRNLRVNLIQPVAETDVWKDPSICKSHFKVDTPEGETRWEKFKKDVAWFEKVSRGSYWTNMQKDHGYNPPPVWTMEGKLFSNMGEAGHDFFLKLATIDPLLHIGTIALLFWAFGWQAATVGAVFWGVNAPANFYWTGGAFLRQDWLFFLVASICLIRKRYFFGGGFALCWSALLRIFPILLAAGWIVIVLIHLVKHRRFHPDHLKVIAGGATCAALFIPLSAIVTAPDPAPGQSTTQAMIQPWKEFTEHILVHNKTPLTNHMGLETVLVHDWMPSPGAFTDGTWRDEANGRMRFTRNDNLDDPFEEWKQGRLDRFAKLKPLYYALLISVVLWMVWALRRTKLLWVGQALSPLITICLVNMTCYYYSIFMISAALVAARPVIAPVLLVGSGASQILLGNYYWVDDKFTAQSYLFVALGGLLLFLYSRPFSKERLLAWINDEPEPKEEPAKEEEKGDIREAEPGAAE